MTISRLINALSIIIGGSIALYVQAQEEQNIVVLMIGIVLLMFGIYRTSRNIPSKFDQKEEESLIETEDDDHRG
jgi:uncharacterized membrane protein YqgA involved in biofilm formation